ncbi:MmgE/PrpD family protein [Saxibacter everestensis]|uniref:MmgE/PrpD family protein n=1 Tax=Saxibacter everestensis TaxID=2909229 RepID=A0ABY8QYF1_9MICO|nr:MmgE/PrpD family protein [Brevibacteriaceae bacterium ZFBP1038]
MSRVRTLGEWIDGVEPADVGADRLARMRSHLLDTVAAAVAGHGSTPVMIAERVYRAPGQAPILSPGPAREASHAARVNAVAAHALEIDDTEGCDHTGAVVVPTLLALLPTVGRAVTGEKLLTAMTVGYEVGRRMQNALGGYDALNGSGWHSTGTCGVFAAAAAGAKLLELSAEQSASALGIAASSSAGTWAFAKDGAMTKRFHPANAAGAGVDAVCLAAEGMNGPSRIFDDTWGGYFAVYGGASARPEGLTEHLGTVWHADHSAIKRYGSCRSAHATLDGAAEFIARSGASAKSLRRAEITLSPFLRQMICPVSIDTIDAARMSLPVALALLLLGESLEPRSFERFADAEVQALASRVTVVEDPDAAIPRLSIEAGGESAVIERAHAWGSEGYPLPAEEVRAKALRLMTPHLTPASRTGLVRFVEGLGAAPVEGLPALDWRWTTRGERERPDRT